VVPFLAGLKMAAFGPFVPRIDENKVFLPGRRHEVPDRVGSLDSNFNKT